MPERVRRTNISFASSDRTVLRGWLLQKANSTRTVLLFHGNGQGILSSMWALYWFTEAFDADVLALDARGFGFSDGEASLEGSIVDSLSIYDQVRALYATPRPIITVGQSMGTASAIHVAANRQTDLLVLMSPFSSVQDIVDAYRRQIPWYVHLNVDRSLSEIHQSPTSDLRRVTAPTLIVRGKDDPLSTEAVVTRVDHACNAPFKEVCVVHGVHDDVHPTNPEVRSCIEHFVARTLPPAAVPVPAAEPASTVASAPATAAAPQE